MGTTRREFLKYSAAAGAWLGIGHALGQEEKKPAKGKKILILGGTAFLGPAVVEAARARGHTVTLFNRGKTNPQLFPDLEKLHGDRQTADLKALEGKAWDAVVDTSANTPRWVRESTALLKDAVSHYVFISTVSVYKEPFPPGSDETAPVMKTDDPEAEKVTAANYGALKALSEEAAEKGMPGHATNIRPGLIVGPGDVSDRFTYWPVRIDRGGEVLAPGNPEDPVQIIDVRDLGEWIVHVIENKVLGVFNATGPKEQLGIGGLLEGCKKALGSDATFTWADEKFLDEQKVRMWSDMPVWQGGGPGSARVSIARALEKGLAFRTLEDTAKATLAWWKTLPEARRAKMRTGLKPEREAKVLQAWRERQGKK